MASTVSTGHFAVVKGMAQFGDDRQGAIFFAPEGDGRLQVKQLHK